MTSRLGTSIALHAAAIRTAARTSVNVRSVGMAPRQTHALA
jgi:hypothetical protein